MSTCMRFKVCILTHLYWTIFVAIVLKIATTYAQLQKEFSGKKFWQFASDEKLQQF